jgi:hypothetical protein
MAKMIREMPNRENREFIQKENMVFVAAYLMHKQQAIYRFHARVAETGIICKCNSYTL